MLEFDNLFFFSQRREENINCAPVLVCLSLFHEIPIEFWLMVKSVCKWEQKKREKEVCMASFVWLDSIQYSHTYTKKDIYLVEMKIC